MIMPPYHGATVRVPERAIVDFFTEVSAAISIPIMIQDAPVAGTALSAELLAHIALKTANVRYFKLEVPPVANKLAALLALGGDLIEGPWDGEEGITLMADLEAGATGTMTGGGYPDGIRSIYDAFAAGRHNEAAAAYARWLPLINYENRQCGFAAAKILMKEGGVIRSDAVRLPVQPVHPRQRAGLLTLARTLDPLVLRWAE
jgi:4-hydroxy-tetrahydrodipicolinate synthase